MTAFPPRPDRATLLTRALLHEVRARAEASPRRRMNFNFHLEDAENPNRLLNVLLRGTYIAPHRHLAPPKTEAFLVLEGRIGFFLFEDDGRVSRAMELGMDPGHPDLPLGIDLRPGVWHTLCALTPHAVCYEVKPGPYTPATDKEFAAFAPREGDPGAAAYQASLIALLPKKV